MTDAIVLLSGGIDSCVVLAQALDQRKSCIALSFHYGQRHAIELLHAKEIAEYYKVPHVVVELDKNLFLGTSALTSKEIQVEKSLGSTLPSTYVPCRNLIFLSHAASLAEIHEASEILFGANKDDFLQYPDCRPSFVESFEKTVEVGSKTAFTSKKIHVHAPLLSLRKQEIVDLGKKLRAPLGKTWSCYDPIDNKPCNSCAACLLRKDIQ